MTQTSEMLLTPPEIRVDVTETGARTRRGWLRCQIGQNVEFSTERLETYCFTNWQPIIFDAFLLAAAVEFADKTRRRSAFSWQRQIELRIPVHDPGRWNDKRVLNSLHDALNFLTGDQWQVTFSGRSASEASPRQCRFNLPTGLTAVMPFSDGLDSRAVAGLVERELGDNLIRVRLGPKTCDARLLSRRGHPFTSVPYQVRAGVQQFVESSSRSRGFKFALLGGLAAYLAKVNQIIVSESGQGALGPALVTVGQSYEDFRSHPLFTGRMEVFLAALLEYQVRFQFPRIWYTKGETLATFVKECGNDAPWSDTCSCWQQNRQVSVDHKKRQCGICAACMLRRMSVHAAGLKEPEHTYVWEDLAATSFRTGAATGFHERKVTGKMREYAIAGVLHLDHLADLQTSPANLRTLNLNAFQLGKAMGISETEAYTKLTRLLTQHGNEWKDFVNSLGKNSFVADWATHGSV